jgi:hypothetical protein
MRVFQEPYKETFSEMCRLKDYHTTVRKYAEEKSDVIFENQDEFHASCLMSAIMDYSTQICMYSDSFTPRITAKDDFLSSLKKFVEEDNKSFDLILKENPDGENPAFKYLKEKVGKECNVTISVLNHKNALYSEIFNSTDPSKFNFCVGDDHIFRFEHDLPNFKAYASFNNKEFTEKLLYIFNNLKRDSTPI